MLDIYERGYTVPEKKGAGSDSEAVQHAVDTAKNAGLNKTVIPRYNKGRGECLWVLEEAVRLPDGFALELDNAVVSCKGNGAIVACGEANKPLENVRISGAGNAKLIDDGADGALLQLRYVTGARVSGIAIENKGTRGIFCLGVTESMIYDITFQNERVLKTAEGDGRRKNGNGITLSAGCANITVEHIFGVTHGNTVEISAFSGETEENSTRDILVRDVRSDCYVFSNVRLVNTGGHMLQNIMVDGVTDLSEVGALYRAHTAVSVGDAVFGQSPAALGETRNITVKNVTTRGFSAVNLCNSVQDITIADLTLKSDGGSALSCDRFLEYNNIYLCNIKFDDRTTGAYPIELVRVPAYIGAPAYSETHFYPYRAVCNMRDIHGNNFKINGVYANMVDNLLRITGKNYIELYDVDVANIVYDDFVGDDCTVNE